MSSGLDALHGRYGMKLMIVNNLLRVEKVTFSARCGVPSRHEAWAGTVSQCKQRGYRARVPIPINPTLALTFSL